MVDQQMPRKKALLDELGVGAPVGGLAPSVEPQAAELPSSLPSPLADAHAPAASPALDFSRMAGYDQGKFDANKQDAKYQMGRTLAGFDPRQGITPDVLNALNGLGYGTFSGSGDKLSLSGLTDKGRANKLTADYKDADFVQGLHGGNGKWSYADPAAEAAQGDAVQTAGGAPGFGGVNLDSALNGDPLAKIKEAIAALSAGRPNAAALMQQLGGGQ